MNFTENSAAATGWSQETDSVQAGLEAAKMAAAAFAKFPNDSYTAFLFAGVKHPLAKVFEGAVKALPAQTTMLAGSTIGVVTEKFLGYQTKEVAILLVRNQAVPGFSISTVYENTLMELGEIKTGNLIGDWVLQQMKQPSTNPKHLWVSYDSIKRSRKEGPPELHFASYLFEGISQKIPHWPVTTGSGMFSDNEQSACEVLYQKPPLSSKVHPTVERHAVWAASFSGPVRADTVVMHGCILAGGKLKVTRTQGPLILEINGKPAVDEVGALLGPDGAERILEFPLLLTFGIRNPAKQGGLEPDFVTRLAIHADRQTRSLTLFEPIPEGSDLTLLSRAMDFEYMRQQMTSLLKKIEGRKPLFATYINCGGRAKVFAGTSTDEAEEVQKLIGTKMPLLGLYTGVEIALLNNHPEALDLSGVLTVVSAD